LRKKKIRSVELDKKIAWWKALNPSGWTHENDAMIASGGRKHITMQEILNDPDHYVFALYTVKSCIKEKEEKLIVAGELFQTFYGCCVSGKCPTSSGFK
jgi:hypothetical protein